MSLEKVLEVSGIQAINSATETGLEAINSAKNAGLDSMVNTEKAGLKTLNDKTVSGKMEIEELKNDIINDSTSQIEKIIAVAEIQKEKITDNSSLQISEIKKTGDTAKLVLEEYLIGEGAGKNTEFLGGRGANQYILREELAETGWFAGVRFTENGSNYTVERLGLAKEAGTSKVTETDDLGNSVERIVSDFDKIFPWNKMERVIIDNNLNVVDTYGSPTYDDTLSSNGYAPHTHMVMRRTPKFYYKVSVKSIGDKQQEITMMVSEYKLSGFEIYPNFIGVNADGTTYEKEWAYTNAFECTLVDKLTGAFPFENLPDDESVRVRNANDFQFNKNGITTASNYFLTSVNARNKQAPTVNFTMSVARTFLENRNSDKKITQYTFYAAEMEMLLHAIEFGNMNGQQTLGDGCASIPDNPNSANNSATVGYTSCLGNSSGSVKITGLKRNGNVNNNQKSISYRGKENPFANIWKFLEGMKTGTAGKIKFGIYNPHVTNTYSDYNANSFTNQKETDKVFEGSGGGYWKLFGHSESVLVPDCYEGGAAYTGGASNTRHGDYTWWNTGGGQIALVGGTWNGGGSCGFAYLSLNDGFGAAIRVIGAGAAA